LLRRELDVENLLPEEKGRLKDQLLDQHLPLERIQAEPADAITAELTDFVDAVQLGRPPRVTGENGRDAIALAERIVASIAAHAWDAIPEGPIGPLALPSPWILRGPHWGIKPVGEPLEHREAG
jgi:predicted dehydrogenase